ncbi:MAG: hypothetical protein HY650_15155 [Acidobacteria bacterium]|nr:hypothetical protein [Acidobacteriota bacterium]
MGLEGTIRPHWRGIEDMPDHQPFKFYTERRLVALTGLRARNLEELLKEVEQVPGSSIFYHTHHQYLSQHFVKPRFYNEFAQWTGHAVQEWMLAEKLGAIDLLSFTSIRQLREAIRTTIATHLAQDDTRSREAPAGEDFHFCKSKSFVMPTGLVAHNLSDFLDKLPHVTNISLFFHFLEARLRLERKTNDFSQWLSKAGHPGLGATIEALDPYLMTLDELRNEIIRLGQAYIGD